MGGKDSVVREKNKMDVWRDIVTLKKDLEMLNRGFIALNLLFLKSTKEQQNFYFDSFLSKLNSVLKVLFLLIFRGMPFPAL